jgi:hypothetical protein
MFPWGVDRTLRFIIQASKPTRMMNPTPYRSLRRLALEDLVFMALSPADYPYSIDYHPGVADTLNTEVLPQNAWYY